MPADDPCAIAPDADFTGLDNRLYSVEIHDPGNIGAATFNFFGSLLSGLVMFLVLYLFARWATVTDPQILRMVLNSSKFKLRYDPAKRAEFTLRRVRG